MTPDDLLLKLLARFHEEGVAYVLVGGQAVRLNGFLHATEVVELLLPASRQNGELDLLFAANGETYESVQPYVREITIDSTQIRVLNIDGLLLAKTDYREKDLLDKQALRRIKQGLQE